MNRPLFRRLFAPTVRDQLDQELELHRDLLIAEARGRGLSDIAAQVEADLRLGDLHRARVDAIAIGEAHAVRTRRASRREHVRQDLHFAVRSLLRQKAWTVVALITLALGIGASTAVFSVVNSLLLRPLPFPNASRIVLMFESPNDTNGMDITVAPFADAIAAWRANATTFDAIEPYTSSEMSRLDRGTVSVVRATSITPGFLQFAGQHVIAGRNFTSADTVVGAERVVMLSEGAWRRDFAADPNVVGQKLLLDGNPYLVIGVMPRALQVAGPGPVTADYWLPLTSTASASLPSIGRLARGATIAAAQRELDTLAARAAVPTAKEFSARLSAPADMVNYRSSLLLLSGAVALVLLIACANVAHLLLARGASRGREFAIRIALGAGRGRLLRQLITEAIVLSLAGCVGGIALGWAGLQLLIATRPDGLAELDGAQVNVTVVLAAIGVSLATGLLFGLTGLVQASMRAPQSELKAGAGSSGGGRERIRAVLVISEMAMAATLLVGAMLLVRSMIHLQGANLGFDTSGLYAVQLRIPGAPGIRAAGSLPPVGAVLTNSLLERIHALPGVAEATLAQNPSPNIGVIFGSIDAEGRPPLKSGPYVFYNAVQRDYFRFMRITLVEGTTFTDTSSAANQVIINRGMAQRYWPGMSAVGKRFRISPKQPWQTVVGVTADVLVRGSTGEASAPMVYLAEVDASRGTILVRMRGNTNPMAAIRSLVTSIDPHLPPPNLLSINDEMTRLLARPRFTMLLLTVFSVIAIILAAVGLYGVLAYAVGRRTREIGIRVALGATSAHVIRRVVANGLVLAAIGAVLGLVASHWATRALAHLLYGVPPEDAIAFAGGAAILLVTAAVASIIPARRAAAIDPMTAIRSD